MLVRGNANAETGQHERIVDIAIDQHGIKRKVVDGFQRTSSLQSPIMLLTGHTGEVYTCRFHPSGNTLASAGHDHAIMIWNTYGECENIRMYRGHKGAVTEICFSYEGERILSSSVDKSIGYWDYEVGAKIRTFRGHLSFVNSCALSGRGTQLAVSASDDSTVKIWDLRSKQLAHSFNNSFPTLACCFNSFSDQVISGGIDNSVKIWDLRKSEISLALSGHTDSITGLKLSGDGAYLVTNSMDNTVRMWDIYPYSTGERCLKVFYGHTHNFEKNLLRCCFSPDNKLVASGSGDCCVYVWDSVVRTLLYKLPGHEGSVNDVDFHPTQPIIVSCGSDHKIYMGELFI